MVAKARTHASRGGRWLAPLMLLAFVLAPGCLHLDRTTSEKPKDHGPLPTRVVIVWSPRVESTPDPTQGGKMIPGLACRLYLLDESIKDPMLCDGTFYVEAHEVIPGPNGTLSRRRLEDWTYDPIALYKCNKPDMFGPGYTLFFPWSTHRPDISRLEMRATFTPSATKEPRFAAPSIINLATPFTPQMAKHAPVGPNIETKSNKPAN